MYEQRDAQFPNGQSAFTALVDLITCVHKQIVSIGFCSILVSSFSLFLHGYLNTNVFSDYDY